MSDELDELEKATKWLMWQLIIGSVFYVLMILVFFIVVAIGVAGGSP